MIISLMQFINYVKGRTLKQAEDDQDHHIVLRKTHFYTWEDILFMQYTLGGPV